MTDSNGYPHWFKWYPSEYFFQDHLTQKYCLAAYMHDKPNEILIGSSMMRQHNFIFDIHHKRVGIARAQCSEDPNFIASDKDYADAGREFIVKKINQTQEE